MLIGGIVAVSVIVVLLAGLLTRRVARHDVHSVEGYHRSLHTLETINTHAVAPKPGAGPIVRAPSAYPESAVRVAPSSTDRLTDALPTPRAALPRIAAPSLTDGERLLTFDDSSQSSDPPPPPGGRDKALVSISRHRRRLAAPAAAVAAVLVLIVVLLVTGSHRAPSPRGGGSGNRHAAPPPAPPSGSTTSPTVSTPPASTPPPVVSTPQTSTMHSATYKVDVATFTLDLSTTSGACWVDVTSSQSGTTLFAGTLEPGQVHVLDATGPISISIGAPSFLVASIDGESVLLPAGFQTPFTMSFVTGSASTS